MFGEQEAKHRLDLLEREVGRLSRDIEGLENDVLNVALDVTRIMGYLRVLFVHLKIDERHIRELEHQIKPHHFPRTTSVKVTTGV